MRKHALNKIVLVIATAMFVMSVWQHELLVIGFVWGTGGTCNEPWKNRVAHRRVEGSRRGRHRRRKRLEIFKNTAKG